MRSISIKKHEMEFEGGLRGGLHVPLGSVCIFRLGVLHLALESVRIFRLGGLHLSAWGIPPPFDIPIPTPAPFPPLQQPKSVQALSVQSKMHRSARDSLLVPFKTLEESALRWPASVKSGQRNGRKLYVLRGNPGILGEVSGLDPTLW